MAERSPKAKFNGWGFVCSCRQPGNIFHLLKLIACSFYCLPSPLLVWLKAFSLYLSVIGQVVGTVHELLQGAPRPIGALVAGGQLLWRRGPSIAHVQGRFPRCSPLHMPPLAEVSRHGVSQQSDVVELPVGKEKRLALAQFSHDKLSLI